MQLRKMLMIFLHLLNGSQSVIRRLIKMTFHTSVRLMKSHPKTMQKGVEKVAAVRLVNVVYRLLLSLLYAFVRGLDLFLTIGVSWVCFAIYDHRIDPVMVRSRKVKKRAGLRRAPSCGLHCHHSRVNEPNYIPLVILYS